jgi:4-hydroxybenzoate polyprenyltransferase
MNWMDRPDGTSHVPLVVDVDGTLLRTDLLHESSLQFLASNPFGGAKLLRWLSRGKAELKRHLAEEADFDVNSLPIRAETVDLIRQAQGQGRAVYLASASDRSLVERLAARVGGIAGFFASDGVRNLSGEAKADVLVDAFGERGFDYVGDRPVDFPVWDHARRALAVCHNRRFERRVSRRFPAAEIVAERRAHPRDYLRAMRPHQWVKNLLLFLPLLAGHHFDIASIAATMLAFLCFCSAASSAYIINDLLDLPSDRAHPRKCRRPFAAGDVPISHGIMLAAILFIGSVSLSLLLPHRFLMLLGLYVMTTLAYSLVLKRKLFVDVITLGGLYTLRVMAGLEASSAAQSEWLLMISLFLFMSLATVKRCSELVNRRADGGARTIGRGYRVDDLPVIIALGTAAGYATSLVLALYIASPELLKLYSRPQFLWLLEPLFLYWISRILLMAHRGEINEDPVIFALTDRISLLAGACVAVIVVLAL